MRQGGPRLVHQHAVGGPGALGKTLGAEQRDRAGRLRAGQHRVRAARRLEEAIGFERESARRDVRTLVEARYDDYRSAVEQHTSLETSLALAQESLRAESRAFAAGVGTSLAVVDAELALSRIEVGRLTAIYDMDVALARLLEASGKSDRILDYLDWANGGTSR